MCCSPARGERDGARVFQRWPHRACRHRGPAATGNQSVLCGCFCCFVCLLLVVNFPLFIVLLLVRRWPPRSTRWRCSATHRTFASPRAHSSMRSSRPPVCSVCLFVLFIFVFVAYFLFFPALLWSLCCSDLDVVDRAILSETRFTENWFELAATPKDAQVYICRVRISFVYCLLSFIICFLLFRVRTKSWQRCAKRRTGVLRTNNRFHCATHRTSSRTN